MIANQVGEYLIEKHINFAGIDVIGKHLTEINITSPTCFKEYKSLCDLDGASSLLDCLEKKIN